MATITLSVALITKRRPSDLYECLTSIAQQYVKPLEVIVVENNTRKTLTSLLSSFQNTLTVKYYKEQKNGTVHARNLALTKASGDLIAFIDDDCVALNTWTKVIFDAFLTHDGLIGLVGSSQNYFENNSIARAEQAIYDIWLSQYFNTHKPAVLHSGMFINTRNFVIKRSFLAKHRLQFNPCVPHKIEDTDFGLRMFCILLGQKEHIRYNPKMGVLHKNSTNVFSFLSRRFLSGRGKCYLDKKYPNFEIATRRTPFQNAVKRKTFMAAVVFFLGRQSHRLGYITEKSIRYITYTITKI